MSNGTNGLRFDVYERVHLPEDVAGIDELEEIELVPRIQVIDQGDQAVLKGQLLLSGIYRGQEGAAGPYALEHWIPVEISLPMNRVSRLDDISIEIDNFDVDLLSARTLNITGVLSLRGISVEPSREEAAEWQEESFTASHQREEAEADSEAEAEAEVVAEEEEDREITASSREQAEDGWAALNRREDISDSTAQEAAPQQAQPNAQQGVSQLSSLYSHAQPPAAQAVEVQREEEIFQEASMQEASILESNEPDAEPYARIAAEAEPQAPQEQAEEPAGEWELSQAISSQEQPNEPEAEIRKPQELQIAFSGKRPSGQEEGQAGLGFRTLLQSSRREQAARQAAEESESRLVEEQIRDQAAEEEIEWKRLFLSKQSEENEFRRIRMCIVQREETLEQIALRYSMNPREILTHNGLHESAVAEGQLLYIPR
ncbi:LysM peptidoglycan-binding domain-containing protein [Paenibacillus sp. PL2-23]|uniref:LysM peptidoglycan-binding domain-containing protein n=1 Tax=Paenibacillus sp. PL2-23 TaxID=2100729 RepID=UPI0030FBF3BA